MDADSFEPAGADNRSILLCVNDDLHPAATEDAVWAETPVVCLTAATENRYDLIVIYITGSTLLKAGPTTELCAILKQNRHTRSYPVMALCSSVNRRIVERLAAAGVDFVVFKTIDRDAAPRILLDRMKEENRPGRVLARLCPYIHYEPIDEDKELTTCRAYANWLVLGPRMLRELCETAGHLNCPYYRNPRLPP
jgi:CheY-like chemotaxis protein